MDYPFENLGPDRFQQLCQALIVRDHPGVQCYPLRQSDGGRDALSISSHTLYQVKFTEKASLERDPHKWVISSVVDEVAKVQKLIEKGQKISRYILVTNVRGTGAPNVGSVDAVDHALSVLVGIDAQCWWRDDVARRLDSYPDLRWAYPELLTGTDVLRGYLSAFLQEDTDRRVSAVRGYIRDQYSIDRHVKFKQVEIQNNLLDLFVDVPVGFTSAPTLKLRDESTSVIHLVAQEQSRDLDTYRWLNTETWLRYGHYPPIGAATWFLHPLTQKRLRFAVLDGAPGQGKSTITQYVCQVHRMRLLGEETLLALVPEQHRRSPVRIPFKVDLRDFATWLSRRDPFSAKEQDVPPADWHKSLESFLAAQVRHHSGGIAFDVADLQAVARGSEVLIACDGLDEIADIRRRGEVIDEICRGVSRLDEASSSVQVIVTTRPVAFANAPAFMDERFPHFTLLSLPRPAIEEYTDKWLTARNVAPREKDVVKGVLKERLDQPHLRDLARNPMQLAILLSLIQTRGSSLPDKRTALYDNYVELFFNREAEKSTVVREHRDLLIDIHRYLAWVLHAGAEQGRSSGSIADAELRDLLQTYLVSEGRDPTLVDALFAGLVERVVALVSRVEGTFEFEVQPLREYFAARFLYETAPYSPPGNEKKGTKPDRFAAIARNFYWLNVTRFYAGCYSKGELPSLIDGLRELATTEEYKILGHPTLLAATLLGDWVFSQHQRSVRDAVDLLTDAKRVRVALAASHRGEAFTLPDGNGRNEFVDFCFEILGQGKSGEFAEAICEVLASNMSTVEAASRWLDMMSRQGEPTRLRWLGYAENMGVLPLLPTSSLNEVLSDRPIEAAHAGTLFRSGRADFLMVDDTRLVAFLDGVLDQRIEPRTGPPNSLLDPFAVGHHITTWLSDRADHKKQYAEERTVKLPKPPEASSYAVAIEEVVAVVVEQLRQSLEWRKSLEPWNRIVEVSRKYFGTRWAHYVLANGAAGIKAKSETCTDAAEIFDDSLPLCRRARYARLRAGQAQWWREQLARAPGEQERLFVLLMVLSWSPVAPAVVIENADWIDGLDARAWSRLYWARHTAAVVFRHSRVRSRKYTLPEQLSGRAAALLAVDSRLSSIVYNRYLRSYDGNDYEVWRLCQSAAINLAVHGEDNWENTLTVIRQAYEHGVSRLADHLLPSIQHRRIAFPLDLAHAVCNDPEVYPREIVQIAEVAARAAVGAARTPVAAIAEREEWFAQSRVS